MFRRVRGELVHMVDHGSGDLAVVGLAGVFGNMELWQQPFEQLHHRFHTVCFDHFGTGETPLAAERVTFDEQVALVGELLDVLEIDRCVLAGDSSLSAVAIAAATRWPERVAGLVVVAGKVDHVPDARTSGFVEALRTSFDDTLDGFVAACLPEDRDGHLRRWLRDIIARTGAERAARLVESFYRVEVRPLLPAVTGPALVIHGQLDRLNPVDQARELAEALPDAELLLLDGTGHVPTLSRPHEIARAIERFADEHVSGTSPSGR